MNGQSAIREPQVGDDIRDITDILVALVRAANRTIEIKLPGDATIAAKVTITDEKVTFDFSKMGVVTTGCVNGQPARITLLAVNSFSNPP